MQDLYFAHSDALLGQRGGPRNKTIGDRSRPCSARPRAAFEYSITSLKTPRLSAEMNARERLSDRRKLETPRSKRVRHQSAQAIFVDRNDRRQVVLPELVVNHAKSRYYNAWPDAVVYFHDREPKIHMLVVSACHEFVRAEEKDWPWSDLFAD